MSRRALLRSAGLVTAAATLALPGIAYAEQPPPWRPRKPRRVGDFLDSLGVCSHIGQGIDSAEGDAVALNYLGVFNVRDDGNLTHNPDRIQLHQATGARFSVIAPRNSVDTAIEVSRELAAAGALLAVEGPNEPNNAPVTYDGQTSNYKTDFLPVAYFMRDLYAQTRSDRLLRHYPVFHSSEAGGAEPNNVGLQFLTIPDGAGTLLPDGTAYADFANTHTYPRSADGWIDNIPWGIADPTINGTWDGLYGEYGRTWHEGFTGYSHDQLIGLPRVMTETGGRTQGTSGMILTAEQQAGLILCQYLSNFTRNWAHTFIYMLRDDPHQGYWGLVDVDYQPKLSGTYIHNLTTILRSGRGARRPSAGLQYAIVDQPTAVHDLLLADEYGALYLAVYSEIADGTETVAIDLHGVRAHVAIYDPTAGTEPVKQLTKPREIALTLNNYDCRIIKVTPV